MSSSRREEAADQAQGRAALVCLTCKAGKRQCDKRLPICSRCRKLDKPCKYPTASQPGAVTRSTQSAPYMDRVWPDACFRCKVHKRGCDRLIPECSRCLRLGASCTYRGTSSQPAVVVPEDIDANMIQPRIHFAPLAETELGVAFEPPMRCRSYMSQLIQFFLTSIALPSDTVVAYSLAHHLRSQWMRHAMSDPCLFHATLFSASASIDMLQGYQVYTPRTLYHHTWAIRLINERLGPTEPVLNYGTLGAVIPLLYYNMLALDRDSAVAHQNGLVKMLLATPQSFRADIGPLIAIVKVAMLSFACIFNVPPVWDCLFSESIRPNTILRNVVLRATFRNDESSFEKETTDAILDVYEAISQLDHIVHVDRCSISAEVERALFSSTTKTWTGRAEYSQSLTPPEVFNVCCQICCQLFWKMLRRRSHPQQAPDMTGDHEVRQLLKYLSQLEPLYWIRNAPEVFTWAAFTGAAASEHQDACASFVGKAGTILTAIDDEKLTLIRQGWRYFRLLKRLGEDDN